MRRNGRLPSLTVTGLGHRPPAAPTLAKNTDLLDCQKRLKQLEEEVGRLKKKNSSLIGEKAAGQQEIDSLRKLTQAVKAENDRLVAQADDLKRSLERAYTSNEADDANAKNTKQAEPCCECAALAQKLNALVDKHETLSADYDQLKLERDLAEEFLRTTKLRLEEVSSKNDALKYTLEDYKKKGLDDEKEILRLKQRIQIERYGGDETRKAEIADLKKQLKSLQQELNDYVDEDRRFQQSLSEVTIRSKIDNAVKEALEKHECSACPDKDLALTAALEAIKIRDERLESITKNAATAMTTANFQEFLIETIEMRDKKGGEGEG